MAPEQIRGESVDGRADQFSLGIVAYQLFSGEMPFQADTWIALSYKIIHDEPPVLAGKHLAVTPGIESAMQRAISKMPADRFASCSEFVEALGNAAPQTTQTKKVVAATPKKRNLVLVGVAMLVMLAGIYWLYPRPKETVVPEAKNEPKAEMAYAPPATPAVPAPKEETPVAKTEAVPQLIDFVPIPAGNFFMGSDVDDEQMRPKHMVRITRPFEMAATETTEKQWNEVMGIAKPGSKLPKVNVSWKETQAFIAKLNQRADGYLYRLPTEAEWEYAARGKSTDDRPRNIDDMAWYYDNSGGRMHEVGTRLANGFGLYDMLGNVYEWTGDWFEEGYYAKSPAANPPGGAPGKIKINRGGAYDTQGMQVSMGWRFGDELDTKLEKLGFRVVRTKR
jgi:sulfatase modifying factor 1